MIAYMNWICALLLATAATTSSEEAAVRAVLRDWMDALARNDVAAVERIVADDYIITAGAKLMNKTEDLAVLKLGVVKFLSAETSDVNVRVFGNTAIVTGAGRYVMNWRGRRVELRNRFTDVYVKRGGRWQPVASHTTPTNAPPAASAPPSP